MKFKKDKSKSELSKYLKKSHFFATGKLIKRYRNRYNVTQSHLAKELGYQSSHIISMVEAGAQKIPNEKLPILCHVLKIDPNTLVGAMVEDYRSNLKRVFIHYYLEKNGKLTSNSSLSIEDGYR